MAAITFQMTPKDIQRAVSVIHRTAPLFSDQVCPVAQCMNRTLRQVPDYSGVVVMLHHVQIFILSDTHWYCPTKAMRAFVRQFDKYLKGRRPTPPKPITFTMRGLPAPFGVYAKP